jgi:palmitoyltransferase ZDHHC13/17
MDSTHANTALHWAILARNTIAINTLVVKAKACLDLPNLRGDTPLKLLQAHIGAIWLTEKVNDKVKEVTQQQSGLKRGRRWLLRLSMDKRLRWWTMVALPFLFFYLIGLLISLDTYFVIKFFLCGCLYAVASTVGRLMFDDHLLTLLPLSIYLFHTPSTDPHHTWVSWMLLGSLVRISEVLAWRSGSHQAHHGSTLSNYH